MFKDIIVLTKSKNTVKNVEILFRKEQITYEYCILYDFFVFIIYGEQNSRILVTTFLYKIKRYKLYYSVLNPKILNKSKFVIYNVERFLFD